MNTCAVFGLTVSIQKDLFALHPVGALRPELCSHSAGKLSIHGDGGVRLAAEVTLELRGVRTNRFVGCESAPVDKTQWRHVRRDVELSVPGVSVMLFTVTSSVTGDAFTVLSERN